MTVAITGATGFVGRAVLEEAARRGLEVRALTRQHQAPRDGVSWVSGDLADTRAMAELCHGARAVVHIAGVVNARNLAGFQRGNVKGTQAILAAAAEAGCQRFVHISSLAAREPELSDYGKSKAGAEAAVLASGLDFTIVRPPAIYGPRDKEVLELFRFARRGVVPMPPRGAASVIHVADLARLLLDLLPADPATAGKLFEPDDGRPGGWPHKLLGRAIGTAVGRRVWAPQLPGVLIAMAAQVDLLLRGRHARLTPDRARYMVHPDWVSDPANAVPPVLWRPQIATPDGLAETAHWYRMAGWL